MLPKQDSETEVKVHESTIPTRAAGLDDFSSETICGINSALFEKDNDSGLMTTRGIKLNKIYECFMKRPKIEFTFIN